MPNPLRDHRFNDPDLEARENLAILAGALSRILAAGWSAFWMALAFLLLGVGIGGAAHHAEATRPVVTPSNTASEGLALAQRALDAERARANAESARAESERRRADEATHRLALAQDRPAPTPESERIAALQGELTAVHARLQATETEHAAERTDIAEQLRRAREAQATAETATTSEHAVRLRAEQAVAMVQQQCAMLVGGVMQRRADVVPVRSFPWAMVPVVPMLPTSPTDPEEVP